MTGVRSLDRFISFFFRRFCTRGLTGTRTGGSLVGSSCLSRRFILFYFFGFFFSIQRVFPTAKNRELLTSAFQSNTTVKVVEDVIVIFSLVPSGSISMRVLPNRLRRWHFGALYLRTRNQIFVFCFFFVSENLLTFVFRT